MTFPDAGRQLPFFVRPFPGENWYSILSRYHFASAHLTHRATSLEIFGRTPELHPTMVLPYQIQRVDILIPPESGLNSIQMMKEHSVWPYLRFSSLYQEKAILPIIAAHSRRGRRLQTRIMADVQHSDKRLRFCPLCARDDCKKEGEAYWHLLPQMKGVLYCHIHGVPTHVSDTPRQTHLRTYYPASSVLKIPSLSASGRTKVDPNKSRNEDWLIQLSSTIAWMLDSGCRLKDPGQMERYYMKTLTETGMAWTDIRNEFVKIYPESLHLVFEGPDEVQYFLQKVGVGLTQKFTPLDHALLLTYMEPAKSFYDEFDI